ncbi:WD40 repeat domain-containing protein [Kitasatospora sp. NPDC048286]|uniref:WD40 repeat domain-containing protein n=1 Tax=Kitasatospora sp. NPDC048286 TaxID=3364047 RepID=UPI003716A26B
MTDPREHRGWIGRLLGGRRARAGQEAPVRPVDEDRRAWARPGELVDLSSLPPRVAEGLVEVAAAIDAADRARFDGDRAEAHRLLRGAVTTEIEPYRQLAEERLGVMVSEDGDVREAVELWLRAARGPDPELRRSVAVYLGSIPFADGAFLVNADPATVLALLPEAWGFGRVGAAVYEASSHRHREAGPAVRRQLLALDALRYRDGKLAARIEAVPVADERFPRRRAEWASGAQLGGCRWSVAGHRDGVSALAAVPVPVDGREVVVTGGDDGTVRLWDLATGEAVGEPMADHVGQVRAVAAAELDGRAVAVSVGTDEVVRVWDLTTRRLLYPPLAGHFDWVTGVDTAVVRGRPVAVTCGDDLSVRVWDLATGQPVGKPMRDPAAPADRRTGRPTALVTTVVLRRPVAVVGDFQGVVRVWDLVKGREFLPPVRTGGGAVQALAVMDVDGRPAVAVGAWDGATSLWDLARARPVGERLVAAHEWPQEVAAVATGAGAAVAVSDDSGMVRLWDPVGGRQFAQAFAGPHGRTRALASTVTPDGRPVVLVGTDDGRVHRWDPAVDSGSVGDPRPGHGDEVTAAATVELDGRALVVSTALDGSVRLWDLATGAEADTPFAESGEPVEAVATAVVGGRPVVLTVEPYDKAVRRWDPATGESAGSPLAHDDTVGAVATTVLDGRPLAVTGSADGLVRVWDLTAGEVLHGPLAGHESEVTAVATAVLDGRPVAVTADEVKLRVWELATGAALGEPIDLPGASPRGGDEAEDEDDEADWDEASAPDEADGEEDWDDEDEDEDDEGDGSVVEALATAVVDGRPVVAAACDDGLVHVWDLATRTLLGPPLRASDDDTPALTTARVAGRPVLVTGGDDGTVRTWDLTTLAPVGPDLVLPLPVGALATAAADRLVVGFGWEVGVFRLVESAEPAEPAESAGSAGAAG